MGLVTEYDPKGVIRDVKTFFLEDSFEHPVSYAKIVRHTNQIIGLNSMSDDVTGVHGSSKDDAAEMRMLSNDVYFRASKAINRVVANCSSRVSTEILKLRFLNHQTIYQVKARLYLDSNDAYYRAERYACYEFAEGIEAAKITFKIADDIIPDFLGRNRKVSGNFPT